MLYPRFSCSMEPAPLPTMTGRSKPFLKWHLDYSTANSRRLNEMSESQLMAYRLLIIPGGNFISIGDHLTAGATGTIHNAVQGGLRLPGHLCRRAGRKRPLQQSESDGGRTIRLPRRGESRFTKPRLRLAGWRTIRERTGRTARSLPVGNPSVGKYPDGTPAIVRKLRQRMGDSIRRSS